jgi:hypothetical protein
MSDDDHVAILRLADKLEHHEVACANFRKIIYTAIGVVISVVMAMFSQVLLLTSKQEVMLTTQNSHMDRMNTIVSGVMQNNALVNDNINQMRDQINSIQSRR